MCRVDLTRAFLADESLHGVMADLDLPPALDAVYGHRLAPRPFLLDRAEADRVTEDVRRFHDLLLSLPRRLFGGSLTRCAEALGVPPEEAALMTADPPPFHGRADLYRTTDGFKLLEFNSGSQLGGTDLGDIARAIKESPTLRDFARDLDYVHPVEELLRATGPGTTAFLEAGGMLAKYAKGFASLQESCRRLGREILLGELEDLTERNGYLYLNGTKLDVVVRFFNPEQAVGKAETFLKGTKSRVFTPLSSYLYGYKSTLALLSTADLDGDEQALVDRILPWTRKLEDVDRDHVRANRANLLLKASGEFAGTGVHAGWLHDDREWNALLDECAHKPHVVQERVRPVLDPMPGDDRGWLTTWGWFVTEQGFAGMSIRTMPREAGAVVSYGGNPDTRVSGLLLG
nr:hypothetical protein GCM10017745_10200 [Saccharothrix mutabilis subsp. capreolus]